MFNLGAGEILMIAVLALLVLGPDRIPSAMRQMGRVMGEVRRYSNGFRDELRGALDDVDDEPVRPPIPPAPKTETTTTPEPPGAPETPTAT